VDFITAAFEQILNRQPAQSELALSLAFLKRQERLFSQAAPSRDPTVADASARARENLVHALFNHNDFLTVH
jgi:hypothetical protein